MWRWMSAARRVTLHLFGARLRSVLHLLLDDWELTYVPSGEGLAVTSLGAAVKGLFVSRVYEVADVTRQQDWFTEERLADLIRGIVAAGQWTDAGGKGKIDVRPGALLIEQAWPVHEQIANLLEELRRPANPADRSFGGPLTPGTAAIYKALETRIDIGPNDTLARVLRGVKDEFPGGSFCAALFAIPRCDGGEHQLLSLAEQSFGMPMKGAHRATPAIRSNAGVAFGRRQGNVREMVNNFRDRLPGKYAPAARGASIFAALLGL